jgi:hypothetical protein
MEHFPLHRHWELLGPWDMDILAYGKGWAADPRKHNLPVPHISVLQGIQNLVFGKGLTAKEPVPTVSP